MIIVLWLAWMPAPVLAAGSERADEAALCDRAAAAASRDTGVPIDVMRAISLTETGRRRDGTFRPWPWTVNMEGEGHWFATRGEALAYVAAERARGARSFDVGCFQINHLWHGKAFASVESMFDPLINARYAADFLSRLHAETGDWSTAAGAYHSRTPALASRYAARFERFREGLAEGPAPIEAVEASPPGRGFSAARPLFAAADAEPPRGRGGSLVTLPGAGRRPFIVFDREPQL